MYLVYAFYKSKIVFGVEVVVVSREPAGQRQGVVHQRVVQDG